VSVVGGRDVDAQLRSDAALLDAISAAVIATDLDGRIFYWNRAAEVLYGYPRERMLGANVMDLFVLPDDRSTAEDIMKAVLAGEHWRGEFPVRRGDGRTIRVRITDSPLYADGTVIGVVGVADDVSETRAAYAAAQLLSDRLSQLARVTAELAVAPDLESVSEVIVSHAGDAVGAVISSLAVRIGDDTLTLVGIRGASAATSQRWATIPLDAKVPMAAAVRTGRRIVLAGGKEIAAAYPDIAESVTDDMSVVALPVSLRDRTLGAIVLTFPGRHAPDDTELEFLGTVADACAQALERVRASDAAVDRAGKLAFLAGASTELASSLDYQTTLANVARLAVPTLADWCAVEVVQDGRLRTLAVAHVDAAKAAMAEELQRRYPSDPEAQTGAPNVVRTGVSELYPEITDDMLVAGSRDEEHLRLSRELQLRSALCVPLTARGRVLGAFTLISAESGRRYDADDLGFAEDLARRAAIAIDNAHLHSETRDAAVRLQRAVLPDALPDVPGWELAAHYAPAGRTEVGGDFYDVLPLEDGRVVVVVGDVMGRGVGAAAAMSQVRASVRAYVAVDPAPQLVLDKLDQMFARYETSQLVTLVYLVCDPATDSATGVNAGHPPPLLVRADGTTETVTLPNSVPLGAGPDDRTAGTMSLRPGDGVFAYSDGLVERRGEDIDEGISRVEGSAGLLATGPLQEQLDRLVIGIHDADRDDDVTALVARRSV
jgi:PAS domain S-box-containing protein